MKKAIRKTSLRACPFCGRKATVCRLKSLGHHVYCENNVCRVKPFTDVDFRSLAGAVAWWNGDRVKKPGAAR